MDENSIKEIVSTAVHEEAVLAWERIAIQILDWPFLLFLLVLIVVVSFRGQISALFERGHIEISWGKDRHIRIKDLSENIDQELDPIRDELVELREKLAGFTQEMPGGFRVEIPKTVSEEERKVAKGRMYKALESPKFRWRTIERLADFSGTSQEQILEFIGEDGNIILGTDKVGRQLARLGSR